MVVFSPLDAGGGGLPSLDESPGHSKLNGVFLVPSVVGVTTLRAFFCSLTRRCHTGNSLLLLWRTHVCRRDLAGVPRCDSALCTSSLPRPRRTYLPGLSQPFNAANGLQYRIARSCLRRLQDILRPRSQPDSKTALRTAMDPNATWQMLCDYLRALHQHPEDEEVRANVVELLGALTRWLRRGGFPPTIG
jgi:hypothetical protein